MLDERRAPAAGVVDDADQLEPEWADEEEDVSQPIRT